MDSLFDEMMDDLVPHKIPAKLTNLSAATSSTGEMDITVHTYKDAAGLLDEVIDPNSSSVDAALDVNKFDDEELPPQVDVEWEFDKNLNEECEDDDLLDGVNWKNIDVNPSEIEFEDEYDNPGLTKKRDYNEMQRSKQHFQVMAEEYEKKLRDLRAKEQELRVKEAQVQAQAQKQEEERRGGTFGNKRILDL
jgi:hypothetical protein